eukprot:gene11499-4663_t
MNTFLKIEKRNLNGNHFRFKNIPKRLILSLEDICGSENEMRIKKNILLGFTKNGQEIIGYKVLDNNIIFLRYSFHLNYNLILKKEEKFFNNLNNQYNDDDDDINLFDSFHIYFIDNFNLNIYHLYYDIDTHRNHFFKIIYLNQFIIYFSFSNISKNKKYDFLNLIHTNNNIHLEDQNEWILIPTENTIEFIIFNKLIKKNEIFKDNFSDSIIEFYIDLLNEFTHFIQIFHLNIEEYLRNYFKNETLLNYNFKIIVRFKII